MELFIFVFLFGFVWGNHDLNRIDSIRLEPQCNSEGGMCTIAVDCPAGSLVEQRGLCPMQRKEGIECCYGISVKETRCERRGGMCTKEFCGNIDSRGTNCGLGERCCILE